MYRPLSVWCVQAGVVSGCGVDYYSSVMQWMVVEVVCVVDTRCWFIPVVKFYTKDVKFCLKTTVGKMWGDFFNLPCIIIHFCYQLVDVLCNTIGSVSASQENSHDNGNWLAMGQGHESWDVGRVGPFILGRSPEGVLSSLLEKLDVVLRKCHPLVHVWVLRGHFCNIITRWLEETLTTVHPSCHLLKL